MLDTLNQVLLLLHFVGLALGFSVGITNMVMSGLIAKATPPEKAVLGRLPPNMSRIGRIGLALLWVTGFILVYTRWNGFATLPWQFHVKLAAVVLLTITVGFIHRLERMVQKGDVAAVARIQTAGKISGAFSIIALAFAILAFD